MLKNHQKNVETKKVAHFDPDSVGACFVNIRSIREMCDFWSKKKAFWAQLSRFQKSKNSNF